MKFQLTLHGLGRKDAVFVSVRAFAHSEALADGGGRGRAGTPLRPHRAGARKHQSMMGC